MKDADERRKRPSAASSGLATDIVSNPVTLGGAVVVCAVWALFGALERFPTEWFILSNIVGTLGAFLMILLIQSAKARETLAVQAKLDQLILSSEAGNHWIGVERHEAEVIEEMRLRHHSPTSV